MKILSAARDLPKPVRKISVAIGFFDGVHLGHQQVIRQTLEDARQHDGLALVVTFDRHPNTIVSPDRVPPLIYSLERKLRAIESLGADHLLLIRFDHAFSQQTGDEFVRALARDCGRIHSLCVGANFAFGRGRSGNVELLRRLGQELGFVVHGLAAVSLDGSTVSSTRIREAIRAGELDATSQMLGRAYTVAGRVVSGDELGRTLGFPTANLDVTGLALPPGGVYAAQAATAGGHWQAVVNIGRRPTVADSSPQLRVEAHLLDFTGDLVGQEMDLTLVDRLRDEIKFASLEDLRAQIARDIAVARERL